MLPPEEVQEIKRRFAESLGIEDVDLDLPETIDGLIAEGV
jgi:hypothetical protein